MTTDKLPKIPEPNQLDQKMEALRIWTEYEANYLLTLTKLSTRRQEVSSAAEFAKISYAIKAAEIPVIYCEKNIKILQEQINQLIKDDFRLLDKFFQLDNPTKGTPSPIQ